MKQSKRESRFAALLLLMLSWCLVAYGQITPSGDAYTNTATPTTNLGTKPLLDVESASQTTYIQFDLSSIPSGYTSASIAKATLKLYVNAVTTAGSFNVDYVNGTWSEKTITADLAPALGTTIVSSVPLTSANVHDYVLIDVTSAVGAWLDGTEPNGGIALVANSPLNASFDSKENTANSHSAELDIVFTGGGTISGVTTASGSGLTGGGSSGTLNLALTKNCAANQVLQWNGSSWVCAAVGTGTITGVTAGSDLTGGGTGGNVTLNLDTSKVPQLTGGNAFTGNQSVNGSVSATQMISTIAQGSAPFSVTSSTQVPNLNASFLDGVSASAFQVAGAYATLGANTFSATQIIGSGDVFLTNGDLDLPQTTSSTVGVINVGGHPFIHACCDVSDTFVGVAGNFTMSGNGNTAVGYAAMVKNTTGYSNAAFGLNALQANTTGELNTATGGGALQSNTTGSLNVASGLGALQSNTIGSSNVGVGYTAGNPTNNQNTTGSNNTYVGFFSNPGTQTTLSNVTAIGASAQVTASNATAIGANAQASASNSLVLGSISGVNGATASTNVGIGTTAPAAALDVHGTGNFTGLVTFAAGQTFPGTGTITGVTAGTGLTGGGNSGSVGLSLASNACAAGSALSALPFTCSPFATLGANTLTGNQSVTGNVSATGTISGGVVNAATGFDLGGFLFASASNQNTFLGFNTGNATVTGCCNTGTGIGALSSNTSGITNTANGEAALGFNTTGSYNTASGYEALYSNVTGNENTANGWAALGNSTSGGANTASGFEALFSNTTGNSNTAVGAAAMFTNTTGIQNTATGGNALAANTTGYDNTATGNNSLNSNTTGGNNVANGWESLGATTTGNGNTAIGSYSLELNSTGSYNTSLGFNAGTTTNDTASTGSSNTFVGAGTNPGTQTGLSNAAAIGANAQVTVSNAMVLGSINGVNNATADTNVGIGTTAPQTLFHIDHAPQPGVGTDVAEISSGGSIDVASLLLKNTGSGGFRLRVGAGTGSGYLASSGPLVFITADTGSPSLPGAAAMTIDNSGNVNIRGNLSKGGGSFKIDHPLDPANKYLYHSFVESPDMKNIYDGVATLDASGEATIVMPDWFGELNRDFRYQLTCIGGFAPVYIAEELANNHFKIGGGHAGMRVSWQVTGIRQDPWANAHRIPVEEEKEENVRGFYLHPELYGAPNEKGIEWARHPGMTKELQQTGKQMQEKQPGLAQSIALPHSTGR